MKMKINFKALPMVVALMTVSSIANAQLVEYTYTGTVGSGVDNTGLFTGSPGTDLTGYGFTATFEFDLSNGSLDQGINEFSIIGGSVYGYATPIVNSVITINGKSVAIDGGYAGIAATQDYVTTAPGGQYALAVSAFNDSSAINAYVYSANLPYALSTPFPLYTATASDQVDGSFAVYNGGVGNTTQQASGVLVPATLTVTSVTGFAPLVTPWVTGILGTNGWYVSATTISWNVSGIAAPTTAGCATGAIPNTKGKKYTCSATNSLGSASDSVIVKVDTVKPAVTITAPVNGTTYALNSTVLASYTCSDKTSGVASCTGTVADGAAITTSSKGRKKFTVASTDNAGNIATKTVTYTVN
jgi:hypothetical protein